MPPSFDFPDSPVVGEEYTPADATFVWSGRVWNVKKPVEKEGIEDVPASPAGEVYGRSVNRWVPLDTTDISLRIPGVGLDSTGPVVNLQPANTKGEIGGVIVVGRSPLNGLEYDLATGTIWVPPGTDILAGSIVEPPNDGMQYVRMRSNDVSEWVQNTGVSIGPTPPLAPVPGSLWWRNDPDGELYIYYTDPTSSQWVPAVKPPGSPIYAGDDPPTSPMANQLWWESDTGALLIYYNDGSSTQWVQVVGGSAGDTAGDFLPLTGGTLSGALLLPTVRPQWPEEAAHKNYVDQTVAEQSLYQGTWQVAANTPDLNTVAPLNAYSWIAQTVDPVIPEAAPAGIPGIAGLMIGSGDTIKWNEALAIYEQIKVAGATGNFLPLAGGVMSGLVQFNLGVDHAINMASVSGLKTMSLSASSGPHAGIIEFFDPNGTTRRGYIGYGDANHLNLVAEGTTSWSLAGGLSFGSLAVTSPQDMANHIQLYGTTFGFCITGGTVNYNASANHDFYSGTTKIFRVEPGRTVTTGNASVSGVLEPRTGINVSWLNGFSGTCQFRVTPAVVSVMLHDVKSTNAYTGASGTNIKMCAYPAGVPAPWLNLSVHIELYTDDSWGHAGRICIIRAQSDGLYMQLYGGGANVDYNANDRISCTLTWAR